MTRLLRPLLVLLLLTGPLGAAAAERLPPGVSDADASAIKQVIRQQIAAFGRGDAAGAYRYAAPNIKRSFPTPEQFLAMVRHAYPPVYHPRTVDFTELLMQGGSLVQHVELVGPDRKPALALYTMIRDGRGGWSIAGCVLVASARVVASLPVFDGVPQRPRPAAS